MTTQTDITREPENIVLSTLRLTSHRNTPKATISESIHEHVEGNGNAISLSVNSLPFQVDQSGSPIDIRKARRSDRIQFAAICFCLFLVGWNDGEFHSRRLDTHT